MVIMSALLTVAMVISSADADAAKPVVTAIANVAAIVFSFISFSLLVL